MADTQTSPPSQSQRRPILDLDLLTESRSIKIDGELYPISARTSRSLLETHKLDKIAKRIAALGDKWQAGDATDGDIEELITTLDRVCRQVLEAPDDVHAKLDDTQRMMIVTAFFSPLRARRLQTTGAEPDPQDPPMSPTSSTSPVVSPASTTATPGIG